MASQGREFTSIEAFCLAVVLDIISITINSRILVGQLRKSHHIPITPMRGLGSLLSYLVIMFLENVFVVLRGIFSNLKNSRLSDLWDGDFQVVVIILIVDLTLFWVVARFSVLFVLIVDVARSRKRCLWVDFLLVDSVLKLVQVLVAFVAAKVVCSLSRKSSQSTIGHVLLTFIIVIIERIIMLLSVPFIDIIIAQSPDSLMCFYFVSLPQ